MRRIQAIRTMSVLAAFIAFAPAVTGAQEPTEHGAKQADGLEVTLIRPRPCWQ